MRTLLLIFLAVPIVRAQIVASPQYQLTGKSYAVEASAIQLMFYNIAGALQKIVKLIGNGETIQFQKRTLVQLQATVPTDQGQTYFCTTCSPLKLVVSTGTAIGNFADAAGGVFK